MYQRGPEFYYKEMDMRHFGPEETYNIVVNKHQPPEKQTLIYIVVKTDICLPTIVLLYYATAHLSVDQYLRLSFKYVQQNS